MLPSSRSAASGPDSGSVAGASQHGRSRFATEDFAVSEVVGFILVFSIISILMVLAMLSFTDAEGDAEERAAELHAQAAANRVASIVVEAALFSENHDEDGDGLAQFAYRVDLPDRFEGTEYTVQIVDTPDDGDGLVEPEDTDTAKDSVRVLARDGRFSAVAELFQAGASTLTPLCTTQDLVPAGPLVVWYADPDGDTPDDGAAFSPCIFLEAST